MREALEPLVAKYRAKREAYARRYGANLELGRANFDKMPDGWALEEFTLTMGEMRACDAALKALPPQQDAAEVSSQE